MRYLISIDYGVVFEWVVEKRANARLHFAAENERPPMTSKSRLLARFGGFTSTDCIRVRRHSVQSQRCQSSRQHGLHSLINSFLYL